MVNRNGRTAPSWSAAHQVFKRREARVRMWRVRMAFGLVFLLAAAEGSPPQARDSATHSPGAAMVGPDPRTAWGGLPYVDLFPLIFGESMSERHFKDWMRMDKKTFAELVDQLKFTKAYSDIFDPETGLPYPNPRGGHGRKTTLQREMACALYVLSGNEPLDRIAFLWGEGFRSSGLVEAVVDRFVEALHELHNTYICWPRTDDEVEAVVKGIKALRGVPHCLGIMDGTHIEIKGKRGQPFGDRAFTSYKKRQSVILHAVVDANGLFMHASAGHPGSMSDSVIFAQLDILDWILGTISRSDMHSGRFILCDSGYCLRPFSIRGYAYDTDDEKEQVLNAYVSSTRVVVENAFGRLKARFRCVWRRVRAHV